MKKTILIIDDEPVDRFIAENIIGRSKLDWDIVSVPTALKALNYLSFRYAHTRTVPDVILLDLLMPITDGIQFLDALTSAPFNAMRAQMRIVALTTSGNPERHREALQKGVVKILQKPLVLDELLKTLQ